MPTNTTPSHFPFNKETGQGKHRSPAKKFNAISEKNPKRRSLSSRWNRRERRTYPTIERVEAVANRASRIIGLEKSWFERILKAESASTLDWV